MALRAEGCNIDIRAASGATRPQAYWTIKQKSLIESLGQLVVKIRPIVGHSRHPCRLVLRRVGRALSLLVQEAYKVVCAARPHHVPMWQLHHGSRGWLSRIAEQSNVAAVAEFDVEDCFLNSPREEALGAVEFWLHRIPRRMRGQLSFAISKDGKAADHIGKSFSPHFWDLPANVVLAVVAWELEHNADFEAIAADCAVVFKQHRGLPIGGHLSAALCELVALRRELSSWPRQLVARATARYRDNFFVAFSFFPSEFECCELASALTEMLGMPVKWISTDSDFRCLELRLTLRAHMPPKVVVAFRTDADRQGESKDVTSWPPRTDPRARLVVHSLLQGLAAKLRLYRVAGTGGYTAAVRAALGFVRNRRYPKRWWVRPFALALARNGVPTACMPRLLRKTLL